MIDGFKVKVYLEDDRTKDILFSNYEAARIAAGRITNVERNSCYIDAVCIYESADEYSQHTEITKRERALAKLTSEEKQLLGLE